MSPILLYLIIAATIFVTWTIGKSLDKHQSSDRATWKTGVVGKKTVQQSIILGLIGGPLVYLLKGGQEELWFCIMCMMAAPFVVDILRPTVTLHEGQKLSPAAVAKLNTANLIGVVVGVVLLGTLIAFSAGFISLPQGTAGQCSTCPVK